MIDVGCFRLLVSSCVSWANVDMIYLWRLSKFPSEGMFPAAAAEQENADRHEMKKMCEVPDWEGCRSVHDRAFNFECHWGNEHAQCARCARVQT